MLMKQCKARERGRLVPIENAVPFLNVWWQCPNIATASGLCLGCEKKRGHKPLSKADQASLRRVLKSDCDLGVVFPGYALKTLKAISEGAPAGKVRRNFIRETLQEARYRAYGQKEK